MATPRKSTIVRLPKTHEHLPTWKALIAKQKAIRLRSLLVSPESFSSTYERESAFMDADWQARLQNPLACTLVAVRFIDAHTTDPASDAKGFSATEDDYVNAEWVGSAVLVGPEEKEGNTSATFELNALFVLPEARGAGLGAQLIESASKEAKMLASGASRVFVRALVARGNERVLKLYERGGFVERDAEGGSVLGEGNRVLVKEIDS